MKLIRRAVKGLRILWWRLRNQGLRVTALWAADHAVRIATGAPILRSSQIAPQLHVGGQYRQRGWRTLQGRGVTAVVNLRSEFDDQEKGIAPSRYLHIPAADDHPPSLDQLRQGVRFIADEIGRGGSVYVHCGAGVGRAPLMAAAYFVSTGMTPDEAWENIRRPRPFIRPTPAQTEQLKAFAGQ
jgi:protein tyrosine phosphatase (PTP) superfamily phosphohydrolase (DUF442 family)